MKKGFMASDKIKKILVRICSGVTSFDRNYVGSGLFSGLDQHPDHAFILFFFLNVGSGSTLSGPATQTKILGSKALLVT